MAITITANNANNDNTGIDVTAYFADFTATYAPQGFGWFSSSSSDFSGNQFANTEQTNLIPGQTTKQSVVFESGGGGKSIDYTFATHKVGGDLNAISFGYGLSYSSGTDSFPLQLLDLRISGFSYVDQFGDGNIVSALITDAMASNVTTLTGLLAASEIDFVGSSGADVFTGYSHNDTISGGGGNDTLRGAGGSDILNGGAGDDTLRGGGDSDILNGGAGNDTFVLEFAAGQGEDRIIDGDGTGSIKVADTGIYALAGNAALMSGETDLYELVLKDSKGADQTYRFQWAGDGSDLVITNTAVAGVNATVEDFINGSFGLQLGPVNMNPVANNDSFFTVEDLPPTFNVLSNDADADGTLDATTVKIVDAPEHGTLSVNATTGAITYTPDADYVGADSFTYTVKDDQGGVSNKATVNLNVLAAPYELTAGDDVFSGDTLGWINAGIPVNGLGGHDYIVTSNQKAQPDTINGGEGNDLIFTGGGNDYVDGGAGDDVIHARAGTDTLIGGTGNDTFVVRMTDVGTTTITDTDGALWHGTFQPVGYPVSWDGVSPPPATSGFSIGGTATVVSPGVWDLEVNSGAVHLTLNWTTGGDLTITQSGKSQTVVIEDYVNGKFGITLANAAPTASNDSFFTVEDLPPTFNVLSNDTDVDGTLDPTTVSIVDGPDHGTLDVNATTGAMKYTPDADYVGKDSFTYTVKDDDGTVSNEATVNLDVLAAPYELTEGDDVFSGDTLGWINAGIPVNGLGGHDYIVTANTGGPQPDTVNGGEGNDLIFVGSGNDNVDGGAGDDVIHARAGTDTLIGGTGNDTFVVRMTDVGTTTITDTDGKLWHGTFRPTGTLPAGWGANMPPATSGFEIKGTATVVSPDLWDLVVNGSTHLTLGWAGGGEDLSITDAAAKQTVVIKDYVNGTFGITLATPSGEPPVAADDSTATLKNFALVIDVLSNDTDAGDSLDPTTVAIVDGPDHGALSVGIDGKVTYTPTTGYVGADSFTYTVKDDDGWVSNAATVNLNVQEIYTLTAGDDVFSGDSIGWKTAGVTVDGLGGHDYIATANTGGPQPDKIFGGEGNDLIFTGGGNDYVDGGAGDDIIHARGGIETLIGGTGNDTFVVRMTDIGTTTITDTDGALWHGTFQPAGPFPGGWGANVPPATVGFSISGTATVVTPGKWDIEVNGGLTHLTLNWTTGGDLTITDAAAKQTVVIEDYVNGKFGITLANAAPTASNDSFFTVQNLPPTFNVLSNDTDVDGTVDPTKVTIVDGPDHGTLDVNATTGAITYTPFLDYVGPDSFTYTVKDDDGVASNEATVNLDVLAAPYELTEGDDVFSGDSLGWINAGIPVNGLGGHDLIVTSNQKAQPDIINGGEGNDLIFTGGGDDQIDGGAGDDVIHARAGTDTVIGGTGNDTFVVRMTDVGTTTITDTDGKLWHGTYQTASPPVSWGSLTPISGFEIKGTATQDSANVWNLAVIDQVNVVHNLTLAWAGTDLTITEAGKAQTVVVKDYVSGTFGITLGTGNLIIGSANADTINGTSSAPGEPFATNFNDTIFGGDGNDTINALGGDDQITGGKGNDNLTGGEGNDTFFIEGTDGQFDTFNGGNGTDTLRITGATAATLAGFSAANSIEIFVGNGKEVLGGTGNDIFNLTALTSITGVTFFDGGAGNDTFTTKNGIDGDYRGGLGNDTFTGGSGKDTFTGGDGKDSLNGGGGNDTLVVQGTEDQSDTLTGGAGTDTLKVVGATALTLASFNATAQSIEIWDGNSKELLGTTAANTFDLSGLTSISGLTIIDGGAGNDTIKAANGANMELRGGAGTDSLTGGDGNDTLVVQGTDDLSDVLKGGAGNDTLKVIGATALTLASFNATTQSIEIWDGNGKELLGTTAANTFDLSGLTSISGLTVIDGGAGSDIIKAANGANMELRGGAGIDTLTGGDGNDTLVVQGTDDLSDVLKGGLGNDTLKVTGATALTLASFNATTQSIEVWQGNGKELLGTTAANTFDLSGLTGVTGLTFIDGGAGNDVITGTSAGSLDLRGNAGDDMLNAGSKGDTLTGGVGKDTLNGGAGNDTLVISGTNDTTDTLLGAGGTDTLQVGGSTALTLATFNATGQSIEVWQGNGKELLGTIAINTFDLSGLTGVTGLTFIDGGAGNDVITGTSAGSLDLRGNAGDDTLNAGSKGDTLTGGVGKDTLNGGAGNDTLVISGTNDTTDTLLGAGGTADTLKVTGATAVTLASFNAAGQSIEVWSGNTMELLGTTAANTFNLSGLTTVTGLKFVDGGAGNDVVTGSNAWAGDLRGGAGDDTLTGGTANETFLGGAGADTITGGGGIDTVSYAGSTAVMVNLRTGAVSGGDATGDKLVGIRNVIGTSGNDTLTAASAGSILNGGAGVDTLNGGVGDDTFIVSGTNDTLDVRDGNDGNDTIKVTGGAVTLAGFSGMFEDIEVWEGSGAGLLGTAANNNFDFTGVTVTGLTFVDGGAGNDVITGSDTWVGDLRGGLGDDVLTAGKLGDTLTGGAGKDTLNGGNGADTFVISSTNDINDIFNGGGGVDTIKAGGAVTLAGLNTVGSSLEVWAGTTNAALTGTAGNDTFDLSRLSSVTNLTFVDGGAGNDVITGSNAWNGDLRGGAGDDKLTGGTGTDTLNGGDGHDTLNGGAGNDTLIGGAGNDTLNGGAGNDSLTGGLGKDVFFFEFPTDGADVIAGFASVDDTLRFDASNFGGGLIAGAFVANQFVSGANPDANQAWGQFLYDTATGGLFWDADGTGAGAEVLIATLTGAPLLTLADFNIVA